MSIYELANNIAAIKPGQWFSVDRHVLAEIAPAMGGGNRNKPTPKRRSRMRVPENHPMTDTEGNLALKP